MTTTEQIERYIASLPASKQADIRKLHEMILALSPKSKLWFLDGRDENGKVVSNPNIGYGTLQKEYANGNSREFYQVGISANSTGLSVYIMGFADKAYLKDTYDAAIGKATLTGYCIKFKSLKDVHTETMKRVILDGLKCTRA